LLPIIYGLCAALSWGSGDFIGGMASRKTGAYRAIFYGELFGIFVLIFVIAFFGEPFPNSHTLIFSILAGFVGTVGLFSLYHAMTLGLMSIAAPVSALLAAVLPVVVGAFMDGLPKIPTLIGFGFALFAVWMVSQGEEGIKDILSHLSDLKLPLMAGIGFGLYFILMHEATRSGSTIWPMGISRFGGLAMITFYMLFTRTSWQVTNSSAWSFIAMNGVLDVSGNLFFILASQSGRLDVASVLSSLFPGMTVLLAWIFLRERLSRNQWIGVISALIAIVLLTL